MLKSLENHILACISEVGGPVGLNFGIEVYNHEWIIFCSVSVDLKGQGHRSLKSLETMSWPVFLKWVDQLGCILVLECITMSRLVCVH